MAQSALKVNKGAKKAPRVPKRASKIGMHKKIGAKKAQSEITKRKIMVSMETGIKNKIESEMQMRVQKNNGNMSVLKIDNKADGKKGPTPKQKRNH
ncbi:hypothetical protein DFA_01073 [Cavenderia fasciculata]|uniref:Uncharacterized protein n=1 Tax=Cavenderia fasciculata TaxID=261658 RepID=F4PQN1_CACFS|nr:uncharacterized protein DFA_01073 [Cavenderia fasciculata]EGG21198.1 hypothetical protein DFA_01073 [Cavenderia fasciculata]|eukprot:XP_004359048.1 hypothetical protein DFA_01073 [Cavenderia fasciculata]